MLTYVLTAAAAVLILLALLLLRRRRNRMPGPRMRKILGATSHRWMRDLVIPDEIDGHIHVSHLLETDAGFVVLDVTRVDGAIFGAARMDQWSVVRGGRSTHFRNPLQANRNRVRAVSHLAGDIPVHGLVVLLGDVAFPKGRPAGVTSLDDLPESLAALPPAADAAHRTGRDEAWFGLAACTSGH